MKKRIICFLLAMILVLGLIPNAAVTANAYSIHNTSEKAMGIISGSVTFYAKETDGKVGYSTPTTYAGAKNYLNGITKEDASDLMRDYINEIVDEEINAFAKSNNIDLNVSEHDALAVHHYRTNGDIDSLLETVRIIKTVNSAADRAAVVNAFVDAYDSYYGHDCTSNEALKPTLDVSLAEAAMYLYGDYGYNGGSRLAFARLDTDHDFEGDDVAAYVKNDGYTLNPAGSDFLGWFLYDSKEDALTGAPLTKLTADHNGKLIVAKQASGDNDPAKYTLKTSTLADLNVYTYGSAPEQTGHILKKDSSFKVTYEFLDGDGVKWVFGSGTTTKGKSIKGWVKVGKAEATEPEANKPIASATVTASVLTVRKGATTNSDSLGSLSKGDVVNIYETKVEKTETGNQTWGKIVNVEIGGDTVTGWINLAYAELNETLGESGEATGQTGKIANAEEVNIRSEDCITPTNKIASLKQGTKVTILEMNADRTWAKIKWATPANGYTQGWVYMHYVHLDSAPSGGTGSNDGVVLYTGVVTSNINLNVRNKADIYGTKVDSLPNGTKINIYEVKTSKNMKWGRIGDARWVCLSYVDLTEVSSGSSNNGTSTTTDTQATVTSATLDVLLNYNNNAQKVGTLKKGDVVTILEKNTETTGTGSRIWGRINKDGMEGWINLAYVELKNVTSVTTPSTGNTGSTGTSNANGANAVIANCISVNIREAAGVRNAQITKLNNGTAVKVYEQVTKDNAPWARITWNGGANEGWVCMNYVTMSQSNSGTADGSLVNGTNSNTISAVGFVNSNIDLNVRAGAGLGYAKIGSLSKGAKVTIYEQVTADGMIWGRLNYGTTSGWVCMSYISVESASSTGKGVMGTIARCFAAVNVRSAPGTNNALIGKINVGTRVEVFETRQQGTMLWGRVAQGWICMDYVLLDSELPPGTILDATEPTTEATQTPDVPDETVNRDNEVTYTVTGTVTTENGGSVYVRNDASTSSDKVGTVNSGLSVNILALKNNNAELWGRIDQYATAGWIRMDYVDYVVKGYVNTDEQPVFANADTSSTVKGNLSLNKYLEIRKLAVGGETVYGWVDEGLNGWIPMGRVSDTQVEVIPTYKKYTHELEKIGETTYFTGVTNAYAEAVSAVNGGKVVFKLQSGVKVPVGEVKLEAGVVWGKLVANDVVGWINLNKVTYTMSATVTAAKLEVWTGKDNTDERNILGYIESTDPDVTICELSFDAYGNLWGKVSKATVSDPVTSEEATVSGGYVLMKYVSADALN